MAYVTREPGETCAEASTLSTTPVVDSTAVTPPSDPPGTREPPLFLATGRAMVTYDLQVRPGAGPSSLFSLGGDTVGVIVGGIVAVLVVALAWWLVSTYNRLVRLRNQTQASWAQIDVQLKRRHELIPNLVEGARGYAAHERATLEAVVAARGAAVGSDLGVMDKAAAEATLTTSLGALLALGESYPQLKADRHFATLQDELTTAEDKIAYARQFYNSAVQSYHSALESFPGNVVAGLGGAHTRREYFEAGDAPQDAVRVRFA
ncbi:LemA family protein [Streptomyces sp. NPDC056670]|uniref:LemA family protein n=1 Tax=Streptomyces sp. NPDC056670 TaxID=3345904 RepID=UPI0036A05E9C